MSTKLYQRSEDSELELVLVQEPPREVLKTLFPHYRIHLFNNIEIHPENFTPNISLFDSTFYSTMKLDSLLQEDFFCKYELHDSDRTTQQLYSSLRLSSSGYQEEDYLLVTSLLGISEQTAIHDRNEMIASATRLDTTSQRVRREVQRKLGKY